MIQEYLIKLSLPLAIIATLLWLLKQHRDGNIKFDLLDLLRDDANGKVSKTAFVFMGTFILSSWVIVKLTMEGKVTLEWFGAYSTLWIVPAVTKIIKNTAAAPPAQP